MFCVDENENCSLDDVISTEASNNNDEDDSDFNEDCLLELTNLLDASRNDENGSSCHSSDLQVDDSSDDDCSMSHATLKECDNDLDNTDSLLEQVTCDETGTNDGSNDNTLDTSTLDDGLEDLKHDQEDEYSSNLSNSQESTIESDDLCDDTFSCDVTEANDSENECETLDSTDLRSEDNSQCDLRYSENKLGNLRNMKCELDESLKDFLERVRLINSEIENLHTKLSKLLHYETKKDVEDAGVCLAFDDESNAVNCRKGKKRRLPINALRGKMQKSCPHFKDNFSEQTDNFCSDCEECSKFRSDNDVNSYKQELEDNCTCPSKKRRNVRDTNGEIMT